MFYQSNVFHGQINYIFFIYNSKISATLITVYKDFNSSLTIIK